jgi:hypothetical protein
LLSEPDFLTNFKAPAKHPYISELDYFSEHLVDEYDYTDIEGNVGRVFWTLTESQCVGELAHIVRSIFRRTRVDSHSDPSIFLDAPEWSDIERLARKALNLIEAEDAHRDPDSPKIFEQKLKKLHDLEQKHLRDHEE